MAPFDHYTTRLAQREHALAEFDRLHTRMGTVRLTLAAIFLALVWACAARGLPVAWLLVPAAAFAGAVIHHLRVRERRARLERAAHHYREALRSFADQPCDSRPPGNRFLEPHHVYAADLDLFGKDSLYQRLCTARTPMGEATLARWLLAPAPLEVLAARQAAIADLAPRLDLREDLAVSGTRARIALEEHALIAWAGAPAALALPWLRPLAGSLAAGAVAGAIAWSVWGLTFPLLAVLSIEGILSYALRNRVHRTVSGIEDAYEDLKLLTTLLQRIEAERFAAPRLQALQARLRSEQLTASKILSGLATLVNFVEARRNPLLTPLMLPLMYTVQCAVAAESWRRRHGKVVADWLNVLGEVEALECFAAYSFERPADPFPEFMDGPAAFIAQGLGHPLIAARVRVRNDVDLSDTARVLLVSGSNMSGKSTLLRSVGMNTVLAMAGAPVCAMRLRLTPLQVGASIHVHDSLQEGSSRFYAEITRLRRFFEPWTLPLVFLLDELLQGTNSTDRRIGAHGVLRALLARGAIGLVSTHDLALGEDAELRAGPLRNVHFQDELHDGRLTFDYRLRDGVVTKSNGVELMRAIGLDV